MADTQNKVEEQHLLNSKVEENRVDHVEEEKSTTYSVTTETGDGVDADKILNELESKAKFLKEVRLIDTRIELERVRDIDTAARTFRADLFVAMSWDMNAREIKDLQAAMDDPVESQEKVKEFLCRDDICPQLFPMSGNDISVDFGLYPPVKVVRGPNNQLQFECLQLFRGEWFMEAVHDIDEAANEAEDGKELDDFPFDLVYLMIRLVSKTPDRDRLQINYTKPRRDERYKPHEGKEDGYNFFPFYQDSVKVHSAFTDTFDLLFVDVGTYIWSCRVEDRYDIQLMINITARRKWQFYINSVGIFVFLLSCLILPGYVLDVEDTGSRLGYFVTLALAQTALMYVTASALPNLSYRTVLDEYILWSFLATLVSVLESALVVAVIEDEHSARLVDAWCWRILAIALVAVNVGYVVDGYRRYNRNSTKSYVYDEDGWTEPDFQICQKFDNDTWRKEKKENPNVFFADPNINDDDDKDDDNEDGAKDESLMGVCLYKLDKKWEEPPEFDPSKDEWLSKVGILFGKEGVKRCMEVIDDLNEEMKRHEKDKEFMEIRSSKEKEQVARK